MACLSGSLWIRIQRLILIDSPSLELTEGGGGLTTVQADLGDNNGDGHNA